MNKTEADNKKTSVKKRPTIQLVEVNAAPRMKRPTNGAPAAPFRVSEA